MNLDNRRVSAVEVPEMSSDEIMNIKEVSQYLKIPVSTVYKLVQDRRVPAVKLGKHWRFMKKDLNHLFEQREPEIFK
jgi:excisionase family DNA binding protein